MFCDELVAEDAVDPLYFGRPSNDAFLDDERFAA